MSLSTHVLDTAKGRPAAGVAVRLEHDDTLVAEGRTDADGRLRDWTGELEAGVYRLIFDVAGYLGEQASFPEAVLTFRITDPAEHHHVPLLLSPFAYTTYRGS